jgi:hypothetical protein
MKTIGFCTHFTQTDEWAFDYALSLARARGWQLTICHWLHSPYSLRRDMVYPYLKRIGQVQPVTPALLTALELELRECYEPLLGDFTNVAFKLCEGHYQVELRRCLRQNLLDLVVMGYQTPTSEDASAEQPLVTFAQHLPYPILLVGPQRPDQFWLNAAAHHLLNDLNLPEGSWQLLDAAVQAG